MSFIAGGLRQSDIGAISETPLPVAARPGGRKPLARIDGVCLTLRDPDLFDAGNSVVV